MNENEIKQLGWNNDYEHSTIIRKFRKSFSTATFSLTYDTRNDKMLLSIREFRNEKDTTKMYKDFLTIEHPNQDALLNSEKYLKQKYEAFSEQQKLLCNSGGDKHPNTIVGVRQCSGSCDI